jgi:hypothetical protein
MKLRDFAGAFFDRGLPNYGIISTEKIKEKRSAELLLSRIRQYDALLVFFVWGPI